MVRQPKHKLYGDAESLFVEQGMTCAAIAEVLALTETTLSKWRKGMQWDDKRTAALASPSKIKEILQKEMLSVASGNKPAIDTDALSKIGKALSYFDGKVPLTVVISVIKELDEWTAGTDPHAAVKNTELHKQFIAHRAKIDSLR